MECIKVNIQYTGKPQKGFSVKLNKHRREIQSPNAIPAYKHFNQDPDFNNDAQFTLIEILNLKIASPELKSL